MQECILCLCPPKPQNILQHHAKMQHLFLHAAMQAQGMNVKNPCDHIYRQIFAAVQDYTKSTHVYGWQQLFPLFVAKNSDMKIKRHSHSASKTLSGPINGEGTTQVTRWRDTVKNGRWGQRSAFYLEHGWGVSDILVTRREEVGRVTSERVTGY